MKILFADALPDSYVDLLRRQGDECIVSPELGTADIPDVILGVDVLVVRSTEVTAATIDRSDNLGLIVRAGAGTNTIDCQAAADSGIYVCNVPGTNSVAVAELTLGVAAPAVDLASGDRAGVEGAPGDGARGAEPGDHLVAGAVPARDAELPLVVQPGAADAAAQADEAAVRGAAPRAHGAADDEHRARPIGRAPVAELPLMVVATGPHRVIVL